MPKRAPKAISGAGNGMGWHHGGRTARDQVIAPLSREKFLGEHWNKSLLRLKGQKGRFAPLPWDELSTILEWQRTSPQLKLFQDGKQVEGAATSMTH